MFKIKTLAGIVLGTALLIAQTSLVFAAPLREDPTPTPTTTPEAPITGTVQSIVLETDSAGVTTVVVTLTDSTGASQTVTLSLEAATSLGLVTTDASGAPIANESSIGQDVSIDPTTVIPPAEEEAQNPVGAAIGTFFGLDYATIDGYHDDGAGYGVIAQACWLSFSLGGDASQCGAIIEAKQSGDYSAFTLPDGTTASNWGQFKKAVEDSHDPLKTLGAIMSGHAQNEDEEIDSDDDESTPEPETDATITGDDDHGQGNGNGNGGNGHGGNGHKGKGKGHGHGKGK